jgi:hypothetical protein
MCDQVFPNEPVFVRDYRRIKKWEKKNVFHGGNNISEMEMQSSEHFVQEKEMGKCVGHGDVQDVSQTSLQKFAPEEVAVSVQVQDEVNRRKDSECDG